MDKLQQVQGAWRFIYEEAPLDDDTPIWVFRGARVIEIGKRRSEGRCEIVRGGVKVTFEGIYGPLVITLHVPGDDATPDVLKGDYTEAFENLELDSYCTLLRVHGGLDGGEPLVEETETVLPLAA